MKPMDIATLIVNVSAVLLAGVLLTMWLPSWGNAIWVFNAVFGSMLLGAKLQYEFGRGKKVKLKPVTPISEDLADFWDPRRAEIARRAKEWADGIEND